VQLISARSSQFGFVPPVDPSSSSSAPAQRLDPAGGTRGSVVKSPSGGGVDGLPVPLSAPDAMANTVLTSGGPQESDGSGKDSGGDVSAIATELLRVLAHDNTVLECNIRDYDIALNSTIEEVVRLKSEARQLESACGQIGQLRELLQREMRACSELRDQNAWLSNRRDNLINAMKEAAEASDGESSTVIDGLISQNTMLRRLLSSAEAASSDSSAIASRIASLWAGGDVVDGSGHVSVVASPQEIHASRR